MSPTPVLGAIIGAVVAGGLVLTIAGMTPRTDPEQPAAPARAAAATTVTRLRASLAGRGLSPLNQITLVASIAGGILVGRATGFWAVALILPMATVGFPKLLAAPPTTTTDRLDAMSAWTRRLAGLIETGHQPTEAIVATLRSAPEPILAEVTALVTRLRARQPLPEALYQFADQLKDPIADKIVAVLIKAATLTSGPLTAVLGDLVVMVDAEVSQRRKTTAAQAPARATVRNVTIVTAVLLLGLAISPTPIGEQFRTGTGQLVLVVLTTVQAAITWWLQLKATPKPIPRIIVTPSAYTRPSGVAR